MAFLSQPYLGPRDLKKILALVKTRPPKRILDYPGLVDLEEILAQAKGQEATCIWETETGQFTGYALINYGDIYASLAFEYSPEFEAARIGDLMIAWGEQAYRERFHGQTEELTSPARDALPERIALLEKHGFTREPEGQLILERSLAEPIPEPRLPDGFIIRPVAGESETEAWVALHRAAFGTQNMTSAGRRGMTELTDYDPELDLVAVAPDGRLAAYVFGSFNREEMALCGVKIGFTDPVATHPDYQRHGLSRALLLESMRRMKARGLEIARLGTSSRNIPMQKTAESVGYCIVDRAWQYSKKLRWA